MNPQVCAVWVNPTTGTGHAVVGFRSTGYRLACRPNTPRVFGDDELFDYRYTPNIKCWNEACWRHFLDPEGATP